MPTTSFSVGDGTAAGSISVNFTATSAPTPTAVHIKEQGDDGTIYIIVSTGPQRKANASGTLVVGDFSCTLVSTGDAFIQRAHQGNITITR